MVGQLIVADEGCDGVPFAVASITDGDRLHRSPCIDGAGEEPRMEGAHLLSIGRGAFGEDQQMAPLEQVRGQLPIDQRRVAASTANEQRAGRLGEPTQRGPGADLGFGKDSGASIPSSGISHQET